MAIAAASAETLRPGDTYVQSFARGLEVIRSFSAAAPRQTLTEVAGRAGLTRAGARRILLTLQTLGYVESDGKLFSLTPRILDLGFAYVSSMPIWNLAEPVMEALVEQVKESCSAAALEGTDIVYVLRVPTRKIMSIGLGVGSRLPAYCTSMGRMLLADLPDDEVLRRLRASKPRPLNATPRWMWTRWSPRSSKRAGRAGVS
jgi:IclR family transcriptional regulator, pca regulon regulatory protein